MSLLLTFRCGVKRIALSVDDETPVRAIDLGVDEDELLLPPIDDEVDQCHLSGVKSVVVQGLTLRRSNSSGLITRLGADFSALR